MDSNRSLSDSNLHESMTETTPPSFISQRIKRKREELSMPNYSDFKDEMRNMIKSMFCEQQKELREIAISTKSIKESNENILKSIELLTAQNDELQKKVTQLENQSKSDRDHIIFLEDKVEEMQRSIRKTSIEIKNAPKKLNETKEDLISMVLNLSKNINCLIEKNDLKISSELKEKNKR